ncbi:hypothetical protein QP531_06425 [Peptoniphilus harei]|uniref:hypothetical protein n=1 Tax=Peptoniphilus harei TaxID=54005 RepID=UPI00254CCEB0|nr:hypothetical protein [Peptoniphilus harei]MDK7377451.1 hypothetical protein [Peptoniphilus harei]MDK7679764.1 hypothetical protein [Peptoniphilus harei]
MTIRDRGKLIIENLAPLIGARPNSKRWNPRTASVVVKNLRIASLLCLDLENDTLVDNCIKYKFRNKLTLQAANIHKMASEYSPSVLNTDYILESVRSGKDLIEIKDLLFFQSLNKRINDSAIIDILETETEYKTSKIYNYLLFILLECFSLYYSLYEFSVEGKEPDKMQLGRKRINELANDIEYVKYKLGQENLNTINLTHHLSVLLMNVLAVNYDINKYFIEN